MEYQLQEAKGIGGCDIRQKSIYILDVAEKSDTAYAEVAHKAGLKMSSDWLRDNRIFGVRAPPSRK